MGSRSSPPPQEYWTAQRAGSVKYFSQHRFIRRVLWVANGECGGSQNCHSSWEAEKVGEGGGEKEKTEEYPAEWHLLLREAIVGFGARTSVRRYKSKAKESRQSSSLANVLTLSMPIVTLPCTRCRPKGKPCSQDLNGRNADPSAVCRLAAFSSDLRARALSTPVGSLMSCGRTSPSA